MYTLSDINKTSVSFKLHENEYNPSALGRVILFILYIWKIRWTIEVEIDIDVTSVSKRILYFRTWAYFRAFWSIRWESSNFVVFDVDGTCEEVSGTWVTRLLGLMNWQRCYNCFSNGFPLDALSLSFGNVTCSINRGNKIGIEELIPLLSIKIRINVGHFFFPMTFLLPRCLLDLLFTLWLELHR